jgi:hypothetical protein
VCMCVWCVCVHVYVNNIDTRQKRNCGAVNEL